VLVWHDCERRSAGASGPQSLSQLDQHGLAAHREAVHRAIDALHGFRLIRMKASARDYDAWNARIARGEED